MLGLRRFLCKSRCGYWAVELIRLVGRWADCRVVLAVMTGMAMVVGLLIDRACGLVRRCLDHALRVRARALAVTTACWLP